MLCTTTVTIALVVLTSLGSGEAPATGQNVPTTTSVVAAPAPDDAMTVTVTVAASQGKPSGTVTVDAGPVHLADLPLAANGRVSFTTGALGGATAHVLTAQFVGSGAHAGSASAPVAVDRRRQDRPAASTVTVGIPTGVLTITSPRHAGAALSGGPGSTLRWATGRTGVVVQDTRAGDRGFTVSASVVGARGDRLAPLGDLSIVDVRASQVPGNALRSADLRTLTGRRSLANGVAVAVATYASGLGTGSVGVSATVLESRAPTGARHVRVAWTVM